MGKKSFKSLLSKANFYLKRNPRISKSSAIDVKKYIPRPYRAVLLISADFELAWGWRYAKTFQHPKQEAIRRARVARKNIPKILELCDSHNIPITWATVGHLFLEKCSKNGNLAHAHLERPPYHENRYWRYNEGDWLDDDPCANWKTSPEWYAPDLIKMILSAKIKHEIACHTFSHIDCRDRVCSSDILKSEINECKNLARKWGVELKSFVHPGHTIGNLNALAKLGFSSFRTDYRNTLSYPIKHNNGLWEFQSTAEFYYRKEWSIDYHINRYIQITERAIEHNRVAYCWFHPSMDTLFLMTVFPRLFSYFDNLVRKNILFTTTTEEYVTFLNSNREALT